MVFHIVRLMRWQWVNNVLRVAFYLIVPMVLSLGDVEPAGWVKPGMLVAYNYAFGALALFTVMTLKATRRQKGFKATPMDFLILVIALVVPNLPDTFISGLRLGDIAVKTIVMFFSFEVLTGELRGELRKISVGVLAALALLAVRGIV
jgi:UDP-GlcNAc:undecaprenyl-phosphate/decaprenyl-phosphate GlcNAc-1-phosphate transferase